MMVARLPALVHHARAMAPPPYGLRCTPSAKGYGSFARRGLRASGTSTHRPMPLPETKARRRSRQQHRRRAESGSNAACCPCSSPDYRSLPLHRRACRVLHLEPIRRSVGASFKLNRLARDHHSPFLATTSGAGCKNQQHHEDPQPSARLLQIWRRELNRGFLVLLGRPGWRNAKRPRGTCDPGPDAPLARLEAVPRERQQGLPRQGRLVPCLSGGPRRGGCYTISAGRWDRCGAERSIALPRRSPPPILRKPG